MISDHMTGIDQFDADLWKIADDLRANANLASNEYFMPILGLLFLRQATNRYYETLKAIEADKADEGAHVDTGHCTRKQSLSGQGFWPDRGLQWHACQPPSGLGPIRSG